MRKVKKGEIKHSDYCGSLLLFGQDTINFGGLAVCSATFIV